MATRNVKTQAAALSRTNKPVQDSTAQVGDGLENVISGLGTSRDKRSYTSYATVATLARQELENMFRTSWLAKRIVNAVPEDMTREWLNVTFDDDNKDHQDIVENAEKRFAVRSKYREGLMWGRLYGGALMLIGIKGEDPSTPLDEKTIKPGMLQSLHILDRWRVSSGAELTTDLDSPNFGLPDYYTIAESAVNFHHTRVIRFNGQRLPYFLWIANARWDDSELQHIRESLLNCDTTTQSVASLVFEASLDIIKVENLAEMLAGKNGDSQVSKRFALGALMKSINRILLLDGKETYENHQKQFTNLDKIVQGFQVDVCGAAEIPMARLFGQSAGGLNATGNNDIRNYYDMISNKQEAEMRPGLERLYRILCLDTLGVVPADLKLEFNPLWQISATEKSTIEKNNADRDKIYIESGVLTEGVVAKELKARKTYTELTDEDIEMAVELSEAGHDASLTSIENGALGLEASLQEPDPAEEDPSST